ncbi:MAG TPA: excinuclease ABC subunit UvrC [Armatimonadota bacterium]|jgi:excinuclease ABC subunit C
MVTVLESPFGPDMPEVSEHIQEKLKALPDRPGVYFHKDAKGEILYIGKAVNLRNRVRSYFQVGSAKTPKIQRMVGRVTDLEWIVTDTELEALILECNMIKKHRPPFNVRMRDDKHYPYLMVTMGEPFPRVLITRRVKRDANKYFGPYTDSQAVYKTTRLIRDVFQIRACDLTFDGIHPIRPCLYYHLGQCTAPCAGFVSRKDYREQASEVVSFLDGKSKEVLKRLRERMAEAAAEEEFEKAAKLRDQIEAVATISEQQKVLSTKMEEQDVIALAGDDGSACVQMFFIREGKLIGQEQFFLEGAEDESLDEQIQSFVTQYYQDAPYVPKEILLPVGVEQMDILESYLRQKKGSKVTLHSPERGDKKRLVEMAGTNATLALKEQLTKLKVRLTRAEEAMDALQEALNLPAPPARIECYDISNTGGSQTVGSMVVFENGEPKKSDYRKFKIKTVIGPNDYASHQEMMERRLKAAEENRPGFDKLPDLFLIDGGKGQLSAVKEVLDRHQVWIPIAGLAKREEEIFLPGDSLPVVLAKDNRGLHLCQRLRDEAHRYGITYHRKLRGKAAFASILDELPGIGEKRRTALLRAFPDLPHMCAASLDQLAAVPGMNRSMAGIVYQHLQDFQRNWEGLVKDANAPAAQ